MLQSSGRMFQKSGLENYYQLSNGSRFYGMGMLRSVGNSLPERKTNFALSIQKEKIITCFDSIPRLCLHFALGIIISNRIHDLCNR